uniref:Uncharacterized protein n=1 Tax=Rhizophora mucronata TaxID=61149 RepID=A0A2P2NPA6_RHIMU
MLDQVLVFLSKWPRLLYLALVVLHEQIQMMG